MISFWHIPWIVSASVFVGFIIGLLQGDKMQAGGSSNSITVNSETIKKN